MAKSVADRIRNRRLPAVEAPEVDSEALRQYLEGVKEHLRMYEGDSGAPHERFITIEELETAGIITTEVKQGFASITEALGTPISTPASAGSIGSTGGNGGATTLKNLTDTSVDGVSVNDSLQWDGANWVGQVSTLEALGDTDLKNYAKYDMLYRDEKKWKDTAGDLQWNPSLGMTLGVGLPIHWENVSDTAVEFLVLVDTTGGTDVDDVVYANTSAAGDHMQEMTGHCLSFDGLWLFVGTLRNTTVDKYPLSVAFDLSTVGALDSQSAAINDNGKNFRSISWSPDGLTCYWQLDTINVLRSEAITTPYTVTEITGTYDNTITFAAISGMQGHCFNSTGTYLGICGTVGTFKFYTLSTPWDISTNVEVGLGHKVIDAGDNYGGMSVSDDGLKVWLFDKTGEVVVQYEMTAAFDESTAAAVSGLTYATQGGEDAPQSIAVQVANGYMSLGYYGTPLSNDCIIEMYEFGAALATQAFTVGDPVYPTVIDGLSTNITSASTDIDGTLNVDGAATFVTTVNAQGAVDFDSTLNVDGVATFGGTLKIFESADVDNVIVSHDGTDLLLTATTTGNFDIVSFTGGYAIDGDLALQNTGTAGDPYWASVEVAAPLEGADDATTYTEVSSNTYAMTFAGNAKIENTKFKFGATSLYMDGSGDYGEFAITSVGATDFTLEGWINPDDLTVSNIFAMGSNGGVQAAVYFLGSGTALHFIVNGVARGNGGTLSAGTWYHICLERVTNDWTLYLDGVAVATANFTSTIGSGPLSLGRRDGSANTYKGYIDEVRLTSGTARYGTAFTPPGAIDVSAGGSELTLGLATHALQIDAADVDIAADTDITGYLAVTGALTALSYGGVLEANLLDKTATEIVTGAYTFKTASGIVVASAAGTEYLTLSHDATDFNIVGTTTTDINVSGITTLNVAGSTDVTGKISVGVTTVTTTSHTAAAEHVILVDDDTAAATVTVTLPLAATAKTIYHIKKLGTTANVIIDGNGTETIDGTLTITLTLQYESVMLVSDGSNWSII